MYLWVYILSVSFSLKLVEYRFGVNFGQVFVDYSGNNYHSVNGNSHSTTSKDTTPTDRGSFFYNDINAITIPKNTLVTTDLTISNTFTILCWFNSGGKDGILFNRYKAGDSLNNYLTVSKIGLGNKLKLYGAVSGSYQVTTGTKESFPKDSWTMISISSTGYTIKGYCNGIQEVSITFASLYSEVGSYLMTIGSDTSNAATGYLWYFVITDTDYTSLSDYYSTSSSSCLTSACTSCSPAIIDPYLGTGCVSTLMDPTLDAKSMSCSGTTYGCSSLASLDCSSCSCGSCTQSGSSNYCWCPSGCTSSLYSCYCPSGAVSGWTQCCDPSCMTCSSSSKTTCLTCVANNALPNGSLGCKCSSGYYSASALYNANACTACNSECLTCDQANICLTCKSNNASPYATIGCNCNSGYYSLGSETTVNSCIACNSECLHCDQANICLTCKSSNASPDATIGCNCNSGYYSLGSETAVDSCIACDSECLHCDQANRCLTCKSNNASPDSTIGCNCNSGYYSLGSKTAVDTCIACDSECYTCSQENLCITCKSTNASPDAIYGCNCDIGYYSLGSETTVNFCLACHNECSTCNQADICSTCISENASPDSVYGCNCNDGYYSTGSETNSNSCLACHKECLTCYQANICLSCISSNALPDSAFGCNCNSGYYSVGSETTLNSCLLCNNECNSCDQVDTCLTCKSLNASPDYIQGCSCDIGYYSLGTKTALNSCITCNNECMDCNEADKCLTCKSLNSSPDVFLGCKCNSGFYSIGSETSVDSCITCDLECESCEEANLCTTCKSLNADPDSISGCNCKGGYYSYGNETNQDSCIPCYIECETCTEANRCTTCKSLNSTPDVMTGCNCNSGYYSIGSKINADSCIALNTECATFTSNNMCETCLSLNAKPDSNYGCNCEPGYYETKPLTNLDSCQKCYRECKTCLDTKVCLTCVSNNAIPDTSSGCKCIDGYYAKSSLENSDACELCSEDCVTCVSLSNCTSCKNSNSILYSNGACLSSCKENESLKDGVCECNEGYSLKNNTCTQNIFNMSLSVNSENKVSIVFSEAPAYLKTSDILLNIKSLSFEAKIIKRTKSSFFIRLTFSETVPENTIVLVTIKLSPLYSVKNSVMNKYNYEGVLNLFEYIPKTYKDIISKSNSASQAVVVSSLALSSILHSPGTWGLINTLQFINYIPLSRNNITPTVKNFLLSVGDFNMIPGLTNYIFDPNSTSEPFTEAKKIGIKTSVYWINIGPILVILLAFITLSPFLLCLKAMKLGKISDKSSKLLENYKYGTFIRFWIQSFLDLVILAVVQIKSDFVNGTWQYYFNNISACVVLLLSFFTFPLVLLKIIYNYDKIQSEETEFKSKFGSLFDEFKNDRGQISSCYYALYFIRRIVFILSQLVLNSSPFVQFGLNVGFTLLTLAYLVFYRPFKVATNGVSNLISEISILLVQVTTFTFNFEFPKSTVEVLEIFIISSVLVTMVCQLIIYLFESILRLKNMVVKYKNRKYIVQSEIC